MDALVSHANVLLQAALNYAERGWHVFPCDPQTKRPLTENGLRDATTDAATIRAWWEQWPYAMIAVRTGSESGIWALDLDIDDGVNGIENFFDLAAGRLIPETTKAKTPRGGTHLFFAWTDGVKNSADKLAPGVDTRGEGGYCMLPPSLRADRKCYQCLCDVCPKPPEAPQWLLDLVLSKPTERTAPIPREQQPRTNGSGAYARAALAAEADAVASAPVGKRNHQLNTSAFSLGQLVGAGILNESEVRHRLTDAANDLAETD